MKQAWMIALLLPLVAQAANAGQAGELVKSTVTVVEQHFDGMVSTTTTESWGPGYPRAGTDGAADCQGGSGGGGVPPSGDEWPPMPGPETPNHTSSVSRSNHYSDGWTMSNTWTRTVTRNPNGSFSDGPWVETNRNASGPGAQVGGPPCPRED